MSTAASNRTREHQTRSEDVLWPTARQTSSVVIPGIHPALAAVSSSPLPATVQQNFGAASEFMRPPTRAYDGALRYSVTPGYQSDPVNAQNTRSASKAQFNSATNGRQPTTTPHEWSSSSAQIAKAAYAPPATMHAPTTHTHPHQSPTRHTSSSQNPKAASTFWNDSLAVASNSKNHTSQPVLVATTPWIPGGFIRPPQPAQARVRSTSSGITDDDLDPEAERQRAERTEQIVRGLLADLGPRLRSEKGEDGRVAARRAKPTVTLKAAHEVSNHPTDDDTSIVRERAQDDRSLTQPPLRPAAIVTATTTATATTKRSRPDAPDPLARAKGIKKSRIATADALSLRSTRRKLKPVGGAEVEREPRAVPVGRGKRHDAKVASVAAPVRRRRTLENTRGIEEEEKKGRKRIKDGMVDDSGAPREVVGKGKKRRTGSMDRVAEEEWVGNGKGAVERKQQGRDKAEEREERQKSLQNGRKRMADDDMEDVRAAGKRELRNGNKVVVIDEEEEEEEEVETERVEMIKSKGRSREKESVGVTKDMSRPVEVTVGVV